jgi:acetyl esterase/lipase
MPLDPKAKKMLDMLSLGGRLDAARLDLDSRREGMRKLMRIAGARVEVGGVEDRALPGPGGPLKVRIYTPVGKSAGPWPGLVFFHGGGLVAGNLDTHDGLCRSLAAAACCRTVSVDYRLAPEHRFPAAIEDACAATAWIAAHAAELGICPERIAVGGDSAGATLAAVVCQWARERASPRIAAQLLLCPALDFSRSSPSRREFAKGYLIDEAIMQQDVEHYLVHGTGLDDPRISPLCATDLAALPPAIVHTAEFDPLRDEGRAYADRLAQAGVAVRHTCHSGMIHYFYAMSAAIPEARSALAAIGRELRDVLAQRQPPH